MARAELELDARAVLAEGPWWDAESRLLYWVDIEGRRVHAYDPESGADGSIDVGDKPGTVVGRRSGGLVVALSSGLALADMETGVSIPFVDPEPGKAGNRLNDGKCDPSGRLWVGSMSDSAQGREGALYRVGADLSISRMLDDVGVSNGIGWSPDGGVMYYIDTPTGKIDAFDFDAESGSISRRRTVVDIPRSMGFPDGMTVDAEGMLWVALWMGWGLGRWDPSDGRLLEKIEVPAARTTSCCFGGPSLDTLYITTAAPGGEGAEGQDRAGGIFAYCAGSIIGLPSTPFAG